MNMNQLLDPKNTEGKINIPRFPLGKPQEYELDEKQPWVKDLLVELNENAESKLAEDYLADSHLEIKLKIEKKYRGSYGEYLLVSGSLDAHFFTQCVRTLAEMKDQVQVEFKACIIDNSFEENEEFEDQVDIFIDNEMYELHFYENRMANIKELIHEQIYLNINQYPVSDYDADLPWSKETSNTKQ
jgi:uncharacterized protein